MANQEIGAYTPETARHILEVVRYLEANGYILKGGKQNRRRSPQPSPIFVRNDSGEECPAFGCMQSIGTVEADGVNYIKIDKPADTSGDAGPFLFNGPDAIEINGYGMAFDGPVVRALGDGSSVTSGAGWMPVIDEWEIVPGGGLFTAIGEDDIDTDVLRIAIGQTSGQFFIARLNAPWAAGSADADIYDVDGTTMTDSGLDATVYDPLLMFATLTTNDYLWVFLQGGRYYAVQAPCPG